MTGDLKERRQLATASAQLWVIQTVKWSGVQVSVTKAENTPVMRALALWVR